MKATILKKAAVLAGSLTFLAGSAFSQTAVSGAGGYTTYDLAAGFNLIGLSLFDPVIVSGTIDAESGATLTDAEPDFTAVLNDPDATYLIEILSGTQSAAVAEIASVDDSDNITLTGAIGAGTADYQIRKAPQLNEVFGTQLAGGAFGPTGADVVWLPDGTGGYDQYFLKTPENEYRSTTNVFGSPAKPISVFYPDGLFIQVQSAAKAVVATGMVKTTGTVVAANTGFNVTANNAPVGNTLDSSGLQDVLDGGDFAPVDIVWLTDGAGGFSQYAYKPNDGQWRTTASYFFGDQGGTAVTSGLFIQRIGADTAGELKVPGFYANL